MTGLYVRPGPLCTPPHWLFVAGPFLCFWYAWITSSVCLPHLGCNDSKTIVAIMSRSLQRLHLCTNVESYSNLESRIEHVVAGEAELKTTARPNILCSGGRILLDWGLAQSKIHGSLVLPDSG